MPVRLAKKGQSQTQLQRVLNDDMTKAYARKLHELNKSPPHSVVAIARRGLIHHTLRIPNQLSIFSRLARTKQIFPLNEVH